MSLSVIGLTGQSGAGKTTVAVKLRDLGFFVIDCDVIAREIVNKGSPVLSKLLEVFGNEILFSDGSLNRAALAKKAFSSADWTQKLNSITHPEITKHVLEKIELANLSSAKAVVIDAAALLESDIKGFCDIIVSVVAPVEIRFERIVLRDHVSRDAALERINAQHSEEYYYSGSDMIIRNYPPYKIDDEIKGLIDYVCKRKS